MITAGVFMEKVANGRIGTSGKFRLLLSVGRKFDTNSVETLFRQGNISRVIPFEELLGILPDLELVLAAIPEMIATVLDVSETNDTAIVAMGTSDGWGFTKKYPVQIKKECIMKE